MSANRERIAEFDEWSDRLLDLAIDALASKKCTVDMDAEVVMQLANMFGVLTSAFEDVLGAHPDMAGEYVSGAVGKLMDLHHGR